MLKPVSSDRFHGRFESRGRTCAWPGCEEAGEFRAPGGRPAGFDGPGEYRWLCLDHVRQFNSGYDYFEGMNSEEILRAQSPIHGWERETRAFRPTAGIDGMPRWSDFTDPLDAISERARAFTRGAQAAAAARARQQAQAGGRPVTPQERRALETLGLSPDADRASLRRRYSELVRRYHPDRNGGDRRHEMKLTQVVDAYQLLRKAALFA